MYRAWLESRFYTWGEHMGADVDRITVSIVAAGFAENLLRSLRAAFADESVQLRAVETLAQAEEACTSEPPDLLFVDLGPLPEAADIEACRSLGAACAKACAEMLLFGGFDLRTQLALGRDCGASDLVLPPFEPAWLATRLGSHLRAARWRADARRAHLGRQGPQADAADLHRARRELLASIAHQIRTPMTAILGMSHLALQSGLNPKQHNYVEKVERSAELLLGTLNDLLDSSRLEAGGLELQAAPFDLSDMMDGVGRLVAFRAEDRGLELLFDLPRDLPANLIGDRARLTQVLVNLGLDAVRRGQSGEVVMGVALVERRAEEIVLRFSIRDNGPGGPEDTNVGKTLGPTLSQQLLGLMGSELKSDPAGQGGHEAHFDMRFGLPANSAATWNAPVVAGGASTLVVDDNASARRILQAMCTSMGLRVETARDGWDALRMASNAQRLGRPFELVLLDWKMPGMDGVECARHLLATPTRPPAILMLTAFGQHDAAQHLGLQGLAVQGVLSKPMTPAALGHALSLALRTAPPAAAARPPVTALDHAASLRGARVLLVEDNPIIQELALELLSSVGMLVTLAENGREALERLNRQSFDGVLMDCQMPVMDGYEATRALRALPHLKHLPVIAVTANTLDGDRERALAAGMNDHVAKPFDVDQMFDTLARWIRPARPFDAPVTAAPPPSADDPLARLPGIDTKVGRSSTMNNDKLYRRLLGMFRDGQRDVVAQFRAARAAGEDAAAVRLAHNLRAVSASLGAMAVQRSAGALERACADKSPDSTIEPLLRQVEADLAPVMAGLAELLPPAAA